MAQTVRVGEVPSDPVPLGTARRTRRASTALGRITAAAAADERLADTATDLLEAVAELLEDAAAPASMPAPERQLWETLGASFVDGGVLARQKVRTAAAFKDLLRHSIAGDAAVATLLRVDRSRISQRVGERSIYWFQVSEDRWYPSWQFVDGATLPGLRKVLPLLDPAMHPLAVTAWFLTPSLDLEVNGEPLSPRDWLMTGGSIESVVALAAGV